MNILFDDIQLEQSWIEYQALPHNEWRKDFFCFETGGYVATHVLKAKDKHKRPGIIAEENACLELAKLGKHVLRLPDNVLKLIDEITIDGKKYRELLKFKPGALKPRGYPDAYFDGQTWDFKAPTYQNVDSLRQLIKESRKADNVVFVMSDPDSIKTVFSAIGRECGRRSSSNTWKELPDVFYLLKNQLAEVWKK